MFPRVPTRDIMIFEDFKQASTKFLNCLENWKNFCSVVEIAETIGLLLQIFEYTSKALALVDFSTASQPIKEFVGGITIYLLKHFEVTCESINVYKISNLMSSKANISKSNLINGAQRNMHILAFFGAIYFAYFRHFYAKIVL